MKKLAIVLMAILLSASVFAQIDPTVVVDREYEGKIDVDVRMPETDMYVADSLRKFDVSFDYSTGPTGICMNSHPIRLQASAWCRPVPCLISLQGSPASIR